MKPVEQVAALVRIGVANGAQETHIEVHLDGHKALLPAGLARALATILTERLALAERIEAQQAEAQCPVALPERRYSSDLRISLDVVHDVERDELVDVVAARLGGILTREGADVWGADLSAVPKIVS